MHQPLYSMEAIKWMILLRSRCRFLGSRQRHGSQVSQLAAVMPTSRISRSSPAILYLKRLKKIRQQSLQSGHASAACRLAPLTTIATRWRHCYVIVGFLLPGADPTCFFQESNRAWDGDIPVYSSSNGYPTPVQYTTRLLTTFSSVRILTKNKQ